MTEVETILEMMRILDSTEEVGDCILWTGAIGNAGHPIYKPRGCGCTLVRRAMFELAGGELEPRIPIDTRCGERTCVNPDHLFKATVSGIAKRAARKGAWKSKTRAAKIAAAKRAKGKLTIEQAREIRMSTESGPKLAAIYGVNKSLITGIRSGRNWKEYSNSNPFAGLMT